MLNAPLGINGLIPALAFFAYIKIGTEIGPTPLFTLSYPLGLGKYPLGFGVRIAEEWSYASFSFDSDIPKKNVVEFSFRKKFRV